MRSTPPATCSHCLAARVELSKLRSDERPRLGAAPLANISHAQARTAHARGPRRTPRAREAAGAGRARVEQLVAARQVRLLPVVLDDVPHHGALGVPEHQAGPSCLIDAEQVQLRAQFPVVPARAGGPWAPGRHARPEFGGQHAPLGRRSAQLPGCPPGLHLAPRRPLQRPRVTGSRRSARSACAPTTALQPTQQH